MLESLLGPLQGLLGPDLTGGAAALLQVLFIDLVLAGDNAVAVGLAAGGLHPRDRKKAILWGLMAAVALRIGFALITVQLLAIIGLLLVGGAAREHPTVLVFGLLLSIGLMGVAATWIANLLHRFRWIGYIGLAIVLYVALHMIWEGARSTVVRAFHVAEYNALVPAPLAIGPAEVKHHCAPEMAKARRETCEKQALRPAVSP